MFFTQRIQIILWISFLSLQMPVYAEQYRFSEEKSQVAFDLKHLGLTTAEGTFEKFEGFYDFDRSDIESAKVSLVIQSSSVTSPNPMIPDLMRSEKFFWSEKYPEIVFTSSRVDKLTDTQFNIHGELSIRGKSNPAVFETTLLEKNTENGHAFFLTHTYISRKDYGIGVKSWLNPIMIAIHESLKISLQVEGIPIDTTNSESV